MMKIFSKYVDFNKQKATKRKARGRGMWAPLLQTAKKKKNIKNKEESPKVILSDLNILLYHADSPSHTFSVTQINKYCSHSKWIEHNFTTGKLQEGGILFDIKLPLRAIMLRVSNNVPSSANEMRDLYLNHQHKDI